MGLYLNPDNRNFTRDLTKDIYIDKSLMINVINSLGVLYRGSIYQRMKVSRIK